MPMLNGRDDEEFIREHGVDPWEAICKLRDDHGELSHVYGQIDALRRQLTSLEAHLELAAEFHSEDVRRRHKKLYGDIDVRALADMEIAFMHEVVFPRLFRGSFLVMLFAVFEDGLMVIAEGHKRRVGGSVSINDFRGDILKRSQKYFAELYGFHFPSRANANPLLVLEEVRHVFAHQAGRYFAGELADTERNVRLRRFKKLLQQTRGLELVNEAFVVPSREYTRRSLDVVAGTLARLAAEVAPDYPDHELPDWDSPE